MHHYYFSENGMAAVSRPTAYLCSRFKTYFKLLIPIINANKVSDGDDGSMISVAISAAWRYGGRTVSGGDEALLAPNPHPRERPRARSHPDPSEFNPGYLFVYSKKFNKHEIHLTKLIFHKMLILVHGGISSFINRSGPKGPRTVKSWPKVISWDESVLITK